MPRDRETPQTGLHERRGEVKLGGELSGEVVPCRQCGAAVELSRITLEVWEQCNRRLKRSGEPALGRDEILCCSRDECKQAERQESDRKMRREHNEVQAIIEAIKRGEAVQIPSEIIKYRPSCHTRIKAALEARREGRLPTLDAEID